MDSQAAKRIATWLMQSKRLTVFTGAGMSTESGIPDFRSPEGVWSKYRAVDYSDFMASAESRHEYWRQKSEGHRAFATAEPNQGHRVIARWETEGYLHGVVTQNIDGLHQDAGNQRVLELHGTARQIACQDCGARYVSDSLVAEFLATNKVPLCRHCDAGRLKHATISFGQSLLPEVLDEASRWCQKADLLLAIGSSLVVTPAADLPVQTKQQGGNLVIINSDPTPLDRIADVVIRESIGDTLTAIDGYLLDFNSG